MTAASSPLSIRAMCGGRSGSCCNMPQLMPSDLFNNIVGFAPLLTMDDAWAAARLAGLEDDIRRMPMGMYTLVGEAGETSRAASGSGY